VPDVLVIVPTYDERENLEPIVERIRAAVPDADLLIIDDNSADGTGEFADLLARHDDHLRVLHRPEKDGLGRAYLAGFDIGLRRGYDFIAQIDADGSHDPAELPAMLALARGGADVVLGSRWVEGGAVRNWPWLRRAISRTANRYAPWALRSRIHDITAGYRVYRADVLRSLPLREVASQGYCFQIEMAWRAERVGRRVAEHPIVFVERERGSSKMHAAIVAEAFWRVTMWGLCERLAPRNRAVPGVRQRVRK
jgi:Glycosyltransferases involved in cell wall biogenesis